MTDNKVELPGGYKPKAVGPSRGPEASNRVTAILPEEIASKQITESIDVEIIGGSGQCDRFCSKISVLAGLPMMP